MRQMEHAYERAVVNLHRQYLHRLRLIAIRLRRWTRAGSRIACDELWCPRAGNKQPTRLGADGDGALVHSGEVQANDKAIGAAVGVDSGRPTIGDAELGEMDLGEP